MRRPWIKIDTSTPDKPEICTIATSLRIQPDAVVGKLIRLWSWAELNRISANDLGVTCEFIDKLVGQKRFGAAMMEAGWLVETDGRLSLPRFERHNGPLAKSRVLTAKRVKRHRDRNEENSAKIITKTPPSNAKKTKSADKGSDIEEDTNDFKTATSPLVIKELSASPAAEPHEEPVADAKEQAPLTQSPPVPPKAMEQPPESIVTEEQPATETTPRKRKPKTDDSANQPMLF